MSFYNRWRTDRDQEFFQIVRDGIRRAADQVKNKRRVVKQTPYHSSLASNHNSNNSNSNANQQQQSRPASPPAPGNQVVPIGQGKNSTNNIKDKGDNKDADTIADPGANNNSEEPENDDSHVKKRNLEDEYIVDLLSFLKLLTEVQYPSIISLSAYHWPFCILTVYVLFLIRRGKMRSFKTTCGIKTNRANRSIWSTK